MQPLWRQLKRHAPYTAFGTATGMVLFVALTVFAVPREISQGLFWGLHPLHVLLSALVTTAVYVLNGRHSLLSVLVVGYVGSVGIATLSDSLMPYWGERLLGMPAAETHIGFIEKWWLVNPLALIGIAIGYGLPRTRLPHAGHVLISTWASLTHFTMTMEPGFDLVTVMAIPVLLFLSVWLPCCTSDIVFPMILPANRNSLPPRQI